MPELTQRRPAKAEEKGGCVVLVLDAVGELRLHVVLAPGLGVQLGEGNCGIGRRFELFDHVDGALNLSGLLAEFGE